MTPFGEAMHRLRAERGISQKQMAAAIGVSPAYLSALEHGKRCAELRIPAKGGRILPCHLG
jgi:DNA-binding XRE family transcriptional regulator